MPLSDVVRRIGPAVAWRYTWLHRRIAGLARRLLPVQDDEDWRDYRRHYEKDLEDVAVLHTQKLEPGDFSIADGSIVLRAGLKALHPNAAGLYETIAALAPKSVLEVGCGGGDHLHNLGVLFPDLSRHGLDVSAGQLALLRERSPHLAPLVRQCDITETLPPAEYAADVAYTQAVIMHIQRKGRHLAALANVFKMARRHVVLMENWWRHWFMDDIVMLHECGRIAWPSLHFYVRRYQERPLLMVVSSEQLPFEPLTDYRVLLDAMTWVPPPGAYPSDGRYRPGPPRSEIHKGSLGAKAADG